MDLWVVGFAANAVVSLAYLAIALHIFQGIAAANQWRKNPLALATAFIFMSCGLGHALHPLHALAIGGVDDLAQASRVELADWSTWLFDGATAVIAVWYWTLRGRFPALVRGAGLFEDMRERERQALEIHDNIVQGLVKAKMSYEFGDAREGEREIEETLRASRKIMSDLLGENKTEKPVAPGDLRRKEARG